MSNISERELRSDVKKYMGKEYTLTRCPEGYVILYNETPITSAITSESVECYAQGYDRAFSEIALGNKRM